MSALDESSDKPEIRNDTLRLTYELREGLTASPLQGDTSVRWWVKLANEGDLTQRASAFIVLLNMGLGVRVEVSNGLVEHSSG